MVRHADETLRSIVEIGYRIADGVFVKFPKAQQGEPRGAIQILETGRLGRQSADLQLLAPNRVAMETCLCGAAPASVPE